MSWIKLQMIKYIDRFRMAMQKDILAIQYLAPLSKDYLPWNVASMRPSSIVVILNEIMLNERRSVLECGCGISTFYIASMLQHRGAHLYTVENDEAWAAKVMEILTRNGLESYVTLINAPLSKTSLSMAGSLWYAEDNIRAHLKDIQIDLLIVDGPPASEKKDKYARYPAVPFARHYFGDDYTIILHDINRAGEQEIIKKWGRDLNITFECRYRDGFIGVGRSRNALDV